MGAWISSSLSPHLEWHSIGKAPHWSQAVAAHALTAQDLMIIQSDLQSNPRWRNSCRSFCSTLWSQFVAAGGLKKYGLVQSPDDGESPHPWSGVAEVCYIQWVNLNTNPLKPHRPPIHLQTWKSRQSADSVSVQYKLKSHVGSLIQPEASTRVCGYSLKSVTQDWKTCFLPPSQTYKLMY